MRARTQLLTAGAGAALATAYALRARRRRALQASRRPSLDDLSASSSVPTIVVLGAGFAGVSAARELARRLPDPSAARIVLVDEMSYLLFTPMLTEVVSGQIDVHDATSPVRPHSPRVTFVQARVASLDLANKRVEVIVGAGIPSVPPARRSIRADHVVLALGSVTNFYDTPGLADNALTNKSVGDAGAIHDRAIALLQRAAAEPDEGMRRALLTFVVGGGGFSGVETMAALNGYVRKLAPYFPGIRPEEIRTILVHLDDRLLPELGPQLAAYAQRELEARGVEVILNTKITGAGQDYVDLMGRSRIRAYTLVWTAGVTPNPVVKDLPTPHGKHGGVITDSALRVPEHPGVWAVGDCAETPNPRSNGTYAATAQNATREGRHAARNIEATLRGAPVTPFVYRPIGELAIVGMRAGVADIYGVHVSGFLAWLVWRAVYLAQEPSPSRRVRIAVDWLLDIAGPRSIPSFPGRGGQPTVAGRGASTLRAARDSSAPAVASGAAAAPSGS